MMKPAIHTWLMKVCQNKRQRRLFTLGLAAVFVLLTLLWLWPSSTNPQAPDKPTPPVVKTTPVTVSPVSEQLNGLASQLAHVEDELNHAPTANTANQQAHWQAMQGQVSCYVYLYLGELS